MSMPSFALHMAQAPAARRDHDRAAVRAWPRPMPSRSTIQGKGGHGAHRTRSIDPIVIGAQIVIALQTIVSRNIDPIGSCVVTVGKFHAGRGLQCHPRYRRAWRHRAHLTPEIRDLAEERVTAMIEGIAAAVGATGRDRLPAWLPRHDQRRGLPRPSCARRRSRWLVRRT